MNIFSSNDEQRIDRPLAIPQGSANYTTRSNNPGILIETGNTTEGGLDLKITDSSIKVCTSGYPIRSFSKVIVVLDNVETYGYCASYFKSGSTGSTINATNCTLTAQNNYSGEQDGFGVIIFEDSLGCKAELIDCTIDATTVYPNTASNYLFVTQIVKDNIGVPTPQNGTLIVSGNNTKIKGNLVDQGTGDDNKNTISLKAGLYTNDPKNYVDAEKYDVVTLKDGDAGYSDGYRYKVVAKSSN